VAEQLQPDHSWKPLYEEARKGHQRGWAFVRLNGKVPADKGWQRGEPAKLDRILKWATDGHNMGLRTGRPSGIVVLDDDSVDGSASEQLNLPRTPTVITGSGKRHLYFRAPDFKVGNSVKTVAEGIDIRGDGGQVVFPGSIHPDTGRPYTWAPGLSPDDVELAELPADLLDMLRPRKKDLKPKLKLVMADAPITTDGDRSRIARYVRAAFEAELDRGYDAVAVRELFAQSGIDAHIDHRAPRSSVRRKNRTRARNPVKLGRRWPIERTNSWLSNFGQLRRSTDRHIIHREAALDLTVTYILTAKLVRWNQHHGATIYR